MLNPADQSFRDALGQDLSDDVFRPTDPHYFQDPRAREHGRDGLVVAPRTAQEVAHIVRACNAARIGVVPYGGGTGLVAGQILPDGPAPVILSLERMHAVRDVSATESSLVVEAGVTLLGAQQAAAEAGRMLPLSMASEGSCQIGGVLATNAGGINTLRYGNARAHCLGLEAVLPSGDLWSGLTALRKDNLGYDLRDLLIGSEGSLGVITAASLRLMPRPATQRTMLLAVPDPGTALNLLNRMRDHFGEVVSAFELIHRQGFEFLSETMPELRQPFAQAPNWSVLAEIGAPDTLPVDALIESFIEAALGAGDIEDGWIAQSEAQRSDFWALRESIPLANRHIGAIASHDIAVPLAIIPDAITQLNREVAAIGDMRVNCFGHVGDGNLHYNVFPARGKARDAYDHLRAGITRRVHDIVHGLGGTVAAEHGVGRLKVSELERYADPARLSAMRSIKQALDPHGIMNPGAVLSPV